MPAARTNGACAASSDLAPPMLCAVPTRPLLRAPDGQQLADEPDVRRKERQAGAPHREVHSRPLELQQVSPEQPVRHGGAPGGRRGQQAALQAGRGQGGARSTPRSTPPAELTAAMRKPYAAAGGPGRTIW